MKLLEKITSLFVDDEPEEEEIELEEEPKEEYKEPPKKELPKIMRESISKEEKEMPKDDFINFDFNKELNLDEDKIEEKPAEVPAQPTTPTKKFNFPIDFDEEVKKAEKREEIPQRRANANAESIAKKNSVNHNVNVLNMNYDLTKKTTELYPKKESNIKPKFKASPVISPVYGILDKNYTKEEVKEKNDDTLSIKRASKKVDFETVRKKAFGNLVDEIKDSMLCENCELYKEVQKISNLKEDDLLYDMTVDTEKEVTIENAYDNYEEFGVAYEPVKEKKKTEVEPEPELEPEPITEIIEIKEEIVPKEEKKEQPKVIENIIINNNVNTNSNDDEEEKVPYQKMTNKVEEDDNDIEVKKEKVPSREKTKKETKEEKVDDDFFELIDSMYKERIDE